MSENAGAAAEAASSTETQDDKSAGKVYTEDQVQKKLRGQGKALEEALARIKAFEDAEAKRKTDTMAAEQKKLEEQGEFKKLLEQERAEKASALEKLTSFQERETQRLEAIKAENDKRLEKLPKNLRELVPQGLDADAMRTQIERVEALAGTKPRAVNGAGGRPDPDLTAEEQGPHLADRLMGRWKSGFPRSGEK